MHILATSAATLDDLAEPVDLGQPPGEMAVLSFTDSDLAGLAAAFRATPGLPSLRLARLGELRHPMSVDLWIDRVGMHAKVVAVRLLGGLDWWRYGAERLSAMARERGIALAILPGEDRDDPRLADLSTMPAVELNALTAFFRAGGRANLSGFLARLARHAGVDIPAPEPAPLPLSGAYLPGEGAVPLDRFAGLADGRPVVPIVFYRSMLLADDVAPVDALAAALARRGLAAAPLFVASLKEPGSAKFLRAALARLQPAVTVTTTAFASGEDNPLAASGAPVLQAVVATTRRSAWADGPRGLAAADLAMHVVLPELDGRVLGGALSFKAPLPADALLAFSPVANRPEPDRVEALADRVAALARLRATQPDARRIAILMPDYPAAHGRTGWAVGLDVPASVLAVLDDLSAAGYRIDGAPSGSRALLDALGAGADGLQSSAIGPAVRDCSLSLLDYRRLFAGLPAAAREAVTSAWGDPADDPAAAAGAFRFRAITCGNVVVALAPDRGRTAERRAEFHDPALPPRHALMAFGLWLRHGLGVHAIVHMGAHGTLEWLPGKAVALSQECFSGIVTGPLPVVYPFIVSNPGEAAQAKRRIAAVTLGHLTPPSAEAGLSGVAADLERLIDEYAQADGLDRRRRDRLARLILDKAEATGLAREANAGAADPDAALAAIDAWLCDVKELAINDGLHIFGRTAPGETDAARVACAASERDGLMAALDGRHVAAGPAGAPARGRRDVMPTGRNLFTADPRGLPTPTAMDLARLAADEVVRHHLQAHGDHLRTAVIDLWGSASLRTGGEEIAQGLALMGCRPVWEPATGRVTGIEVQPAAAAAGRPRVDVTFRISGLFRDLFPAQIALIDAAVRAVAARDEAADENPLAEARRRGDSLDRIFGTAPGAYGAGVEDLLQAGDWDERGEIGQAYLVAASHAYGGAGGEGARSAGFADRVAAADALIHAGDDPGRDLLEGSADAAFLGGFAAAAERLGRAAALVVLDTTDPARPRARPLAEAIARAVRGRAANPRWIAGQMRHGPAGAAQMAETADRLVAFAEATGQVSADLIDLLHASWLGDEAVRAFLERESPQAVRAIASRLSDARRRGLWHPRRNDVDRALAELAEAAP